jgi:hypothetical protein
LGTTYPTWDKEWENFNESTISGALEQYQPACPGDRCPFFALSFGVFISGTWSKTSLKINPAEDLAEGAFQNFAFRNPLLASVPVFSNSDAKL